MPGPFRVTVTLSAHERQALHELALVEVRAPRDQARVLLRQGLQRRGYLVEGQDEVRSPAEVVVELSVHDLSLLAALMDCVGFEVRTISQLMRYLIRSKAEEYGQWSPDVGAG